MVRKKLAMAVLALSALQADLACALGLGNLSVKSALNQPLNAEIRLLDTGDLDPSQIKVQLAAPEDFERAGVDRNFFLTNLKFTVDMDGRGTGVIRISTHDAVVEPYLNFVVEAKWPNGRLLREFAVLLDPPTFSAGAAALPAQVAPPTKTAPVPRPTRQLEPPTVTSTPAAPSTADKLESNTLPEAAGASEHRVQVNETLGQIAARHRPATDISVQQTMVAIQRANPDAFIHNNINLIKSGAVLRLPSAEDARAVATGEATATVTEQTHSWRSGASGAGSAEPASGPQLDASQPKSTEAAGFHEKERLTIATPGSSDKSTAGEGSGKSSKGLDALRNQLTASQEGLDSAKRDNKELQSRLDDMERQVATLQRLISLKDDQLTALQAKSAQPSQPVQQAGANPVTAPATATSKELAAQAPVAEQPVAATAAIPTPVAPAPTPATPKPTAPKVAPKPAPEPSFFSQLTSNPLYLGGLAALAALLVGGGVLIKKRREQAEEESAYQDLDLNDYAAESDVAIGDVDLDHALVSDDAIVDSTQTIEPIAATEPEKKPLRSETGDAIAEADIYIAYGRYQQAVDLLTSAIDAEPDRTDLRIKLLEVYLEMRNRDAFRQQFMALQGLGDSDAVVRVKEMLSSVDGVSDWLSDLPQPTTASAASDLAALGGAAVAGAAAVVAAENFSSDHAVSVDDGELDLDLDLDLDADFPESTDDFAAAATASPDTFSTDSFSQSSAPLNALPSEPLDDLELDLDEVTSESLNDLYLGELEKGQDSTDVVANDTFGGFDELALGETPSESLNDLYLGEFDKGRVSSDLATSGTFGGFNEPAPAFDPFVANSEAENEAMELELGEDELDLDLNEEDLDFALRAMEGNVETPAAPVPAPTFEAPTFESPAFNASNNVKDTADDLQDFDLSLADEEFTNASEERKALEADLGDLGDLEGLDDFDGLGDLEGLEDLSFETPSGSNESFATTSRDHDAAVLDEPFADLQEPAPSFAPAAPSADADDFDFLADTDEVATKLDLARAYIDMGDTDGAKDILDEVLHEGSDVQKQEASELLGRIA